MANRKVTLLDGAVGTSIWEKTEDKLPVWIYNLRSPAVVRAPALEYAAYLGGCCGCNPSYIRRMREAFGL